MKIVANREYGSPDVLRIEEADVPTPSGSEVLVKVQAASVNAGDWHLLRADPALVRLAFGLFKPSVNILGADIAGTVEALGPEATRLKPGDGVYGDISAVGFGAFAEYVCVPESALALKPERLSFEESAAVPAAAVTALQGLRDKGKIEAGQRVLINGASGGVGTFAVQIAHLLGAEVTAVCSTRNVERVVALGADHVIDYTREDFAQAGKRYDLILAANGNRSIFDYRRCLTPKGTYVMTGGDTSQFYQVLLLGGLICMGSARKMTNLLVTPNVADLNLLATWLDAGTVKPVIDRRYPFEEIPEAIRYLEEGHAQGKVVIAF